jgi:hypothetical protein
MVQDRVCMTCVRRWYQGPDSMLCTLDNDCRFLSDPVQVACGDCHTRYNRCDPACGTCLLYFVIGNTNKVYYLGT